ncbi:hypothetical protein CCR84_10445 [Rhodocyclus purpureus]|nr:hypothetical protein [Rhodocyclus purpureus]
MAFELGCERFHLASFALGLRELLTRGVQGAPQGPDLPSKSASLVVRLACFAFRSGEPYLQVLD